MKIKCFANTFTMFSLTVTVGVILFILQILKISLPPYKEIPVSTTIQVEHILCIVVPFRDRWPELLVFAQGIEKYLKKKNIIYRMLIMHQTDQYRFNRASLINVGYYESRQIGCDYLAMHDVDLLPLSLDLDYGYPTSGPYHVSASQYHPMYHYENFVGGILILTLAYYKLVNGMSNRYWGWGKEDDEFYLRIVDAGLTIFRPQNLSTDSTNTFQHIHNNLLRKRDNTEIGNQSTESRKRDKYTGLNDVIYEIDNRIPMRIGRASLTIINVKLNCNKTLTPWCQFSK